MDEVRRARSARSLAANAAAFPFTVMTGLFAPINNATAALSALCASVVVRSPIR